MPSSHPAESESDGLVLMAYLSWLGRRWWILLLAAILGTAGGLAVNQLQTARYTSNTSMLVRPLSTNGESANANAKVNLDTEAQVVRSLVVAERARELMKSGNTADQLVRSVTITVPPNSQILQVGYEADSPRAAQYGSHAFAQAYLDLRKATAQKTLETEINVLKQQIADGTKQLGVVAGRIAAAPSNSVERERAEAERNVLTNNLTALNNRLSPLQSADTNPGEIISDARLPERPSSPNRTLNLASGAGAGLLLGIALALALGRLDTRVRRGRDIVDRVGLPLLLELPAAPSLTVLPAGHKVSRELGRLRNVLLSAVPEPREAGRGRQLLLCDGSVGSAAGFVAANLAAAYARSGQQVALVTTKADSAIGAMTGVAAGRHSLAAVLRRDVPALKALAPVPGLTQLRVLVPGDLETDVELPVAGVLEILAELSARFDHVLIETAQPTVAVEAQALARHVDAVIVVAESGRTRSGEITAALEQFEQVGAPVIGAVLAPRLPVPVGMTPRPAPAATRPKPRPSPGPDRAPSTTGPSVESTMILPRMKSAKADPAAGPAKPAAPAPSASPGTPVPVTGSSGTYRSRGDSGAADGGRTYPLESGEDHG